MNALLISFEPEGTVMPKRIVDGEGLWRSEKLASVREPWMKAEFANLIPLALANGSFECNPRLIWSRVYAYNRPEITPEQVEALLSEFERVKLLFRWADSTGKVWGYWIGIDKPGRLADASIFRDMQRRPNMFGLDAESMGANLAHALDVAKANAAISDMSLAYKRVTGRISAQEEELAKNNNAVALYSAELEAAKVHLANLQVFGGTPEELKRAQESVYHSQERLDTATAHRDIDAQISSAQQQAITGVREFWQEITNDSQNAAAQVRSVMSQSMNGLNSELARMMTGQRTSWQQMFRSIGTSLAESGLKKGEGVLAKAFGLKRDGSSVSSALFVTSADKISSNISSASTNSGIGGFLKAFSGFIPGLAEGGNGYGLTLVGERGPELLNLPVGSHVTKNSDTQRLLSTRSGVTINNTIDARGTNAAEVDRRVREGSLAAYRQALSDSQRMRIERNARVPAHMRS